MYKPLPVPGGWLVCSIEEGQPPRPSDGRVNPYSHYTNAARRARQLNKKGEEMANKIPVEWITREGRFITEIETRYREDDELTHSKGAVHKFDEAGKQALLEKQIAGDTPTEKYEREWEDPHMVRRTSSCIEERVKNR